VRNSMSQISWKILQQVVDFRSSFMKSLCPKSSC
jgi:hypothetical protein